ncbi:MAG TPA: oligopeptide/dipeptide ABC transporter ATP-binding protein, partial [Clostridia bacterium]|nr:oligopeptide/dipeptide ABC transporter ATP-binding protein [Clostridia bacterium]
IIEPLRELKMLTRREIESKLDFLLEAVGLENYIKDAFPHQLSGGMRQRVLFAMGLSCDPRILILDEPTNSLDLVSQKEILEMVTALQEKIGFSLIVISHDLSVVKSLTDEMGVLYGGEIVEQGKTDTVIDNPFHCYTRGLIGSSAGVFPYKDLWGIPGDSGDAFASKGCVFASRCTQSLATCFNIKPPLMEVAKDRRVACNRGGIVEILRGRNIKKSYRIAGRPIPAVSGISISINHGETVALIGESGSGKSTLAQILAGIIKPESGEVFFDGEKIVDNKYARVEKGIQIILQDPFSSTSHRLSVEDAVLEPLKINKIGTAEGRKEKLINVLHDVQLPVDDLFLKTKCSSLSGGQRQRVAIARGLVMTPRLLLADEITAMLDVSTRANILRLLKGLQNKNGFAMLYITHDINLARKVAEKIVVLRSGLIKDQGTAKYLAEQSCCDYTKQLMEAGL